VRGAKNIDYQGSLKAGGGDLARCRDAASEALRRLGMRSNPFPREKHPGGSDSQNLLFHHSMKFGGPRELGQLENALRSSEIDALVSHQGLLGSDGKGCIAGGICLRSFFGAGSD